MEKPSKLQQARSLVSDGSEKIHRLRRECCLKIAYDKKSPEKECDDKEIARLTLFNQAGILFLLMADLRELMDGLPPMQKKIISTTVQNFEEQIKCRNIRTNDLENLTDEEAAFLAEIIFPPHLSGRNCLDVILALI